MGVLLLCGFGASSAFSYFSARGILDRQLANTTLPLTAQALSGEVEQYLTPQGLLSSSMARNTFLESWVAAGERDQSAISRPNTAPPPPFLCPIAPVATTT